MRNNIKIYATCFWQSDQKLFNDIVLYGFGKPEWKNIQFTLNDDYDIIIVLTAPNINHKEFGSKTVVTFLTEPPVSQHHWSVTDNICPMYLPLPWCFHSKEKDNLLSGSNYHKTELFSAVTSELFCLEGHKQRLQFLLNLDSVIVSGLDIFGKKQTGAIFSRFNNYRSELIDKYDGLIPYQYHFACENSFINDYFTEKILDPIIAESLCFYDGCNNIEEYIDERVFIKINVRDIENSIDTIVENIENNEWSKRRKYIIKEKQRILFDLNPLNIIWAALSEKDLPNYFKL